MTVWHGVPLELGILALMLFLVGAERSAVGFNSLDSRMGHIGCGEITAPSSDVQRCIDHYGFPQMVTGCAFDVGSAYLAYRSLGKSY